MDNQDYDYSDFAPKDAPLLGDNSLAELTGLALEQKEAEAEVARLEQALKEAQSRLRHLSEVRLPEMMDAVGMSRFVTQGGIEIRVAEKIRGSIPKASEAQAFKWLDDNGHSKLIKREFRIEFDKDEEAWAKKFQADLNRRKRPLKHTVKRSIHPSTLQSFVREQLEEGVEFPLQTFGVYRQRYTDIKVT